WRMRERDDDVDFRRRTAGTSERHAALPATGLAAAEAQSLLGLIRTLPPAYHEPLILRLVEGMTGPEIATRTGLTPGSVRVNLHRGMEQLRTKLGRVSTALRKRNEHER